jgi:hypothetical protein
MMKKGIILSFISLLAVLFLFGNLVSAVCNLDISMLNQDPYPAIPGDYVKVVFQIDGLENSECGEVTFGIKEEYPISLDPNITNPITIKSGTFQANYGSFYLAPYKLRLDENALDGENPIEVYHTKSLSDLTVITEFNLTVKDIRADFEIHVKDYNYNTRELTFEILNIAESDVEALTIEIPKQEGIEIKGTNRMVVGDLDTNEYTTADFEAILPEKEIKMNLNVIYTDSINVRREMQKVVDFDSSYFIGRNSDKKAQPYWLYTLIFVVVIIFVWRRIKKNKREKERMKKRGMVQ